ncbi:hypothetical protein ACOSQ3_016385 [Xanthoceras sorbifolium]
MLRMDWWVVLQQEVLSNPFYERIKSAREQTPRNYLLRDGVWFKKGRILLSPSSTLLPAILSNNHSTPIGDHFGFLKTLSRIQVMFSWSGVRNSVKKYIQE